MSSSSASLPPSRAPVEDSFVERIAHRAQKTFVNGFMANFNLIRQGIKHDIKQEIQKTYAGEFSAEHERLFEAIYKSRVYPEHRPEYKSDKPSIRLSDLMEQIYFDKTMRSLADNLFHLPSPQKEALRHQFANLHKIPLEQVSRQHLRNHHFGLNYFNTRAKIVDQAIQGLSSQAQQDLQKLIQKKKEEQRKRIEEERGFNIATGYDPGYEGDYEEEESKIEMLPDRQTALDFLSQQFAEEYRESLKQELKAELANPRLSQFSPRPLRQGIQKYYLYDDPHFPNYNANWIEGTNFIAAEGPKEHTINNLFFDLFINPQRNRNIKVSKIVGIGSCDQIKHNRGSAFYNYLYDDRCDEDKLASPLKYFEVGQGEAKHEFHVKNKYVSDDYRDEQSGFVCSSIRISDWIGGVVSLDALLIGLPDNCSLNLEGEDEKTEKLKECLWQLARTPSQEAVVIHCVGGVGRTGHLILTLEILKDYQNVFAGDDEDAITQRIDAIIKRIRINREPLIATHDQMVDAIHNAHRIYQYAYKKGYIPEVGKSSSQGLMANASQRGSIILSSIPSNDSELLKKTVNQM